MRSWGLHRMTGGMGAFPERVADVGVGDGWAGSISGMTIGDLVNAGSNLVVVAGPEMPWLASMYGIATGEVEVDLGT